MASDTDLKSHVHTYDRMIGTLKWGGLAVFLVAALVVWLIA